MPLIPCACTQVPHTPESKHIGSTNHRSPNRAQVHKILEEFATKHMDRRFTLAEFAQALRIRALIQQQQQQILTIQTDALQPAPSLTPSHKNETGKRGVVVDYDFDENVLSSPSKKLCIDLNETAHVPLGDYDVQTPPRRIIISRSSHKEDTSYDEASPCTQRHTPIDGQRMDIVGIEHIGKRNPLPTIDHRGENPRSPTSGALMRRHGNSSAGLTPSTINRHFGGDIPTFSTSTSTAQRKAAPSRLNLELPGAAPGTKTNKATHYVALPAYNREVRVKIDELQKLIDNEAQRTGDKPLTLLKKPMYNLEPIDLQGQHTGSPFLVKSISRTSSSTLASSFGTKFSLLTPTTRPLSTAARTRLRAASQRAEARIAVQVGTTDATGKPSSCCAVHRKCRSGRVLAAMSTGKSCSREKGSSRSARQSVCTSKSTGNSRGDKEQHPFDLISALSRIPELAMGMALFLPPRDVLTLYSVSVQFHTQINTFLQSSIAFWTRDWAPDAAGIFRWDQHKVYEYLAIQDPTGRPLTSPLPEVLETADDKDAAARSPWVRDNSRKVTSIKWYQMVALRDDVAIDILSHLARQGFRCPKGTKVSLLKMWMIMDLPTNQERRALLARYDIFSDQDLLNIVLFITKLAFRLNDPIYGPETTDLLELMLGQKSLYSLWEMLFGHNYRDYVSLVQCKIRYDLGSSWHPGTFRVAGLLDPKYMRPHAPPILGVPGHQVGRLHLEHWGEKGVMVPALLRPSECVMAEAARRRLKLDEHLMGLVIWGHVDQTTGRNIAPSEDEIWMRHAAYKNRSIDTSAELTPFHCRRARWDELDERGRKKILLAQKVREESVYKWDDRRYDDRDLTFQVDRNLSEKMRQCIRSSAGTDAQDPCLKVDADGNEIRPEAPPSITPGLLTAGMAKSRSYVCQDQHGYESESSVGSLEAALNVNDDSKVQFAWEPLQEDHAMHIPKTAPPHVTSFGDIYSTTNDEETDREDEEMILGDERFEVESEVEYENIWDMWEEMESKVFSSLFDDESDNTTDI